MPPLVSVVIPTYNDAETLPRAIDSVLSQTYTSWELVVVDDGSTDDTQKKLETYEDDTIDIVVHEENKGGSAARNTGIHHTSGEYVAFLDADDVWLPQKLQVQIDEMEARSEEWVAVYCDKEKISGRVSRLQDWISEHIFSSGDAPKEGGEELLPRIFMMEIGLGASTFIVKRDVIEKIGGFDPSFNRHQDLEFVIRLVQEGKLAYVDRELVKKFGYNAPSPENLEEVKQKFCTKFEDEIEALEEEGYAITDRHELELATYYLEQGQFAEARRHMRRRHFLEFRFFSRMIWSVLNLIISRL